jgi:hypothetical protein
VDAKSIIGVLSLGVSQGDEIEVICEGNMQGNIRNFKKFNRKAWKISMSINEYHKV